MGWFFQTRVVEIVSCEYVVYTAASVSMVSGHLVEHHGEQMTYIGDDNEDIFTEIQVGFDGILIPPSNSFSQKSFICFHKVLIIPYLLYFNETKPMSYCNLLHSHAFTVTEIQFQHFYDEKRIQITLNHSSSFPCGIGCIRLHQVEIYKLLGTKKYKGDVGPFSEHIVMGLLYTCS